MAGEVTSVNDLLHRLGETNRDLILNAGSLVGAMAVTSGTGFLYWLLAARQFPAEEVGFASASISAMTLLGTIGMLGLGTLLMGEIPRHRDQAGTLISTSILASGTAGVLLGILFALVAPHLSADFLPLSANLEHIALFALGVSFTAVTLVLDQSLIGLLRGEVQLWRNSLFAIAKLVALFLAGIGLETRNGMTIYATWLLGNVLSIMICAFFVMHKRIHLARLRPQPAILRGLGRVAVSHHMLNLSLLAPSLTLPVLVTVLLSASVNASFYIAWMLAGFIFIGSTSFTTVLFTVGAADPLSAGSKLRTVLKLAVTVGIAGNLVLLLGADYLLRIFGPAYADQSAICLRILALGVFPIIVKDSYIAIHRISNRVLQIVPLIMAFGFLELVLAAAGAQIDGLTGLSLGWVAAMCIEMLILAPRVFRTAFSETETAGEELKEVR